MVRLKAGGPLMTVRFEIDELLLCVWIDAGGRTRRATYSPQQLDWIPTDSPVWVDVLLRLSSRWPVVVAC